MFHSVFLPHPFSGLCRVPFGHSAALHSRRSHRKTMFSQSKRAAFHSFISFRKLHFIHSFKSPHLLFPQKNCTSRQKTAPALRQSRRQTQPSFRCAALRAIRVCHPRSTRRRLAPLHCAGKKITSLRYADFLPAPFRLKAVLPALFCAAPAHSPRPPTPENS